MMELLDEYIKTFRDMAWCPYHDATDAQLIREEICSVMADFLEEFREKYRKDMTKATWRD